MKWAKENRVKQDIFSYSSDPGNTFGYQLSYISYIKHVDAFLRNVEKN